jgi:hypothetical protein
METNLICIIFACILALKIKLLRLDHYVSQVFARRSYSMQQIRPKYCHFLPLCYAVVTEKLLQGMCYPDNRLAVL